MVDMGFGSVCVCVGGGGGGGGAGVKTWFMKMEVKFETHG